MTALPPPRYLTPGVLALALAWAVGPSVAEAKGPQPKPDFTISVFFPAWDWALPGYPVGTFSSTGLINDSGDVYYLGSFRDVDDNLQSQYLFVGLYGSFETTLPAPEKHGEYAFELSGGTEAYVGLNAAGTAKAATHRSFWGSRKEKVYYLDVSWKMEGFLIP